MGSLLTSPEGDDPHASFSAKIQNLAAGINQLPQHAQTVATGLHQMAASVSAIGDAGETFKQALSSNTKGVYDLLRAQSATQLLGAQPVTGGGYLGGGGFFGGGEAGYYDYDADETPSVALKEYGFSIASATKKRLVRDLARVVKQLGIEVDENDSIEAVARVLEEQLPNPKRGDTFTADGTAQKALCKLIANAFNNVFTPGASKADRLIDTSLGAASVCKQVVELVRSMAAGIQTEFIEVHANLQTVARNVAILDEALKELFKKVLKEIEDAHLPTGADKKIADFRDAYVRVQQERERQMLMLRNFINVTIAPAQEELAIAMREIGSTHDMIARLKLVPGKGDFADTLAMAVSAIGTIAAISARVDKALTEIGFSVKEYLETPNMEELEKILDEKLLSSDPSSDIGAMVGAMQILKSNFERRKELQFGDDDEKITTAQGGAEPGDGISSKSTLDRRVERQKTERKLVVKNFIEKSARKYTEFLKAVQELSPRLGKEIPLSDNLRHLRNALARLSQSRLGPVNLDLALIGYYGDAAAREQRDMFISNLEMVLGYINDIMSMELYAQVSHYFAPAYSAIKGLIDMINFYTTVIAKKFGRDVLPHKRRSPATGGDDDDDENGVIGGELPEELSAITEISRSAYSLERAVSTFLYFYYIAQVYVNLAIASKEINYYSEKYTDILGDAVGARIRQLTRARDAQLALYVLPANPTPAQITSNEKSKKFINDQHDKRCGLFRGVQAIDLALKDFTREVTANPSALIDLKKALDSVEIIDRWYNEETGDNLVAAFEQMPSIGSVGSAGAAATANAPATAAVPPTRVAHAVNRVNAAGGNHYYEKLAASTETDGLFTPGIPQLALPIENADGLFRNIDKVCDNFQVVKNLINVFVRLGDKFNGKEIHTENFMSPTQIFQAINDYIKFSALTLGVKNTDPTGGAFVPPVISLGGRDIPVTTSTEADACYEVYFSSVYEEQLGSTAVEDGYLALILKALVAKPMVTSGICDLFERPGPVHELIPIRTIIGGGDFDSLPEAIPEAAELYFRLVRLVEFYKELFAFDTSDGAAAVQISMLADIEGVFSGVVRLIFQRVEGEAAAFGNYSDFEIRALIREINAVYESYREEGVDKALTGLIMEVNRRYGLVKKEEWETLQKFFRESRRATDGFAPQNQTNYTILPGEDEHQPKRMAPSDRYLGPLTGDASLPAGKYTIDDGAWVKWKLVNEFRARLVSLFGSVPIDEFSAHSYTAMIHQAMLEMSQPSATAAARFAVATRLIKGSDNLANSDVSKTFMFHETVVVGLNTLNAINTILSSMVHRVIATDVVHLRKLITDKLADVTQINPAFTCTNVDVVNYLTAGGVITINDVTAYVNLPADLVNQRGGAPAGAAYALVYDAIENHVRNIGVIDEKGMTGFSTYALNNSRIMEDLLGVIIGLATSFNDLVHIRFPRTAGGELHLDFTGLRDLIQSLMADVRFFMNLFRPHIPKKIIGKYENRENPGSYYWLEEHLLDGLVRGLPEDGMTQGPLYQRPKTLEWVSRTVNSSFMALIGFNPYTLEQLAAAVPGLARFGAAVPKPGGDNNYEQYGRLFAKLTYYDAVADDNSGLQLGVARYQPNGQGLDTLIKTSRNATYLASDAGQATTHRIRIWSHDLSEINENRSLLMVFNQLLAKYVQRFYDSASGKIYRNLLDNFTNSPFNQSIIVDGHCAPDISRTTNFGMRGDPLAGGTLCQSLGMIIRRIIVDIGTTTQVSDHLVATLSDIPLYQREIFRANLPGFSKFFRLMQRTGDIYKQVLAQTHIRVGRPYGPHNYVPVPANANFDPTTVKIYAPLNAVAISDTNSRDYASGAALAVSTFAASASSSEDMKIVINRVIDEISGGCYVLSNACTEVLRELADEPLYLQTHENSIQEFKIRHNVDQLMPLSTSLTYLSALHPAANDSRCIPVFTIGEANFKMAYGTRKLLGTQDIFTLADAPGIRANLEQYNGTASDREKIDTDRYNNYLANVVGALRFVVDARHYAAVAIPITASSPFRVPVVQTNAGANQNIGNYSSGAKANTVYQLRQNVTLPQALALTENSYPQQEVEKISGAVSDIGSRGDALGNDRHKERIFNLVDMNQSPINVHALMRGLPLANLFNYAFTFNHLACLTFGETLENINALDLQAAPPNTRQLFLKLLLEPYLEVGFPEYGGSTAIFTGQGADGIVRIFRGDDSLMMGRPKFICDQMLNKALLGTQVDFPAAFDETGPPGSGRLVRALRSDNSRAQQALVNVNPPAAGLIPANQHAMWADLDAQNQAQLYTEGTRNLTSANLIQDDRLLRFGALTYLGLPDEDNNPQSALKVVQLGQNAGRKLFRMQEIGFHRYNTRFVRTLIYAANLQRLLRRYVNQKILRSPDVLATGQGIANSGLTEYGTIEPSLLTDDRLARFGPGNETSAFRRYNNETRLVY